MPAIKAAFVLMLVPVFSTAPAQAPAPASPASTEPPIIVLTEKQRMVLVDTIAGLKEERDDAEARALFWYRKAKGCEAKVQI